ncbi:MAG: beta-hydroxyacyl-ACP dehydratase [Bacteroidales bacterium]|nr:beta-hydroxyacyl-ACP dehydratase [Bacteroidales bacterium]MBP5765247.1 beta-hydroxyacyl-ACP dehydratase [Bacteroidales bacterium]
MLLKDKFFTVLHEERLSANEAIFLCELKPDCDVYRGHFPGKPVSPGVCNIEMIRECTEMLVGEDLQIDTIKQCRMTAVASPSVCPKVDVSVSVARLEGTQNYNVVAMIRDAGQSYMELKGTFVIKD